MNTKRNSRCLLLTLGILLGLAACEKEPAPQEIINPTIMEAASPTVTEDLRPQRYRNRRKLRLQALPLHRRHHRRRFGPEQKEKLPFRKKLIFLRSLFL